MIFKNHMLYFLVITCSLLSFACNSKNRYKDWSTSKATVNTITEMPSSNSGDSTSPKYKIEFTFKSNEKNYQASQIVTQGQAKLVAVGESYSVHVNPNKKQESELELPVPYPDKSGMNWRRMPKSLTTPGTSTNQN